MEHKHELKWKKKGKNKTKQLPPGGKQVISKLCNDSWNASQIKVKSWKWSFSKDAHCQYTHYIIMLH